MVGRIMNERMTGYIHPGYRDRPVFLHEPGEWISDNIRKNKTFYEISILHKLRKRVSFQRVIDIGANIGNHSRFFCKFGSKVFSVEPVLSNYDLLIKNAPNAESFNLAISNERGILEILIDERNSGISRFQNYSGFSNSFQVQSINTITLDDLGVVKPTFVKIDVEGFELKVLEGGLRTLTSCAQHLMIEVHHSDTLSSENYPYKLNDLLQFVEYLGFTLETKLDRTNWLFCRE